MKAYNKFDCEIYSEEVYPVTEQEYDEVQAEIAAESENFVITNGTVRHKPEPPSNGRIGGIEL